MWGVLLIILIIYLIYRWWSMKIEQYSPYYAIPDKNAFLPLSTPMDQRYVFLPNRNIYLLPYEYLNFREPFHRWMYYYYPTFYASYYNVNWPFYKNTRYPRWIK